MATEKYLTNMAIAYDKVFYEKYWWEVAEVLPHNWLVIKRWHRPCWYKPRELVTKKVQLADVF